MLNIQSPLSGIRSPFWRRGGFSRGGFSPAVLFANNEPGVWYDPSDLSTLFQDTAGTTPVTTPGQTVALMLDKSKGLTLGPELVTNGTFDTDTSGWTPTNATLSVSSQRLRITKLSTYFSSAAQQITGLDASKTYQLTLNGYVGSAEVRVIVGSGINSGGIYDSAQSAIDISPTVLVTGKTSFWVTLLAYGGTGTYLEYDNISVKELSGFHATQPTTAARPTYQVDAGGRGYLSFDGVDDWMVTPTITPGIDKVQIFVGLRKLSDVAGFGIIAEYGPPTAGTFSLTAPAAAGTDTYLWSSRGSIVIGTADSVSVSGYAAPITNILTSVGEISTDTMILRVDGAQAGSSSSNQGAGNYLAYPMYIGRRTGTSLPLNGQIYSLITRFGANLEVAQIESTEAYVAGKTGVDL